MLKIFLVLIPIFITANTTALSNSKPAENKSHEAVVQIFVPGPDQDGDIVDGLCNATLIDSKTMISAAHCFARSAVLTGSTFRIEVGAYKYIERNGQQIRIGYVVKNKFARTAQVRFLPGVNPQSQKISPDLDVSLITLDQDLLLPADFMFAKLWENTLPRLDQNSKINVVTINPIETISSTDTKQFGYLNSISQKNYQLESKSFSRVAPGDSGAGVFATIEGQNYIIGVVKGSAKTIFSDWDVLTLIQNRFD